MDFDFSDEQRMLQDTVRRYVNEKIVPVADAYDRKGPMSKGDAQRFLKEMRPFGYVGTLVPEAHGGPGLTHMEWPILFEELRRGYSSLGGIVGITSSTMNGLARSGNEELKKRILPGLLGFLLPVTSLVNHDPRDLLDQRTSRRRINSGCHQGDSPPAPSRPATG